MPRGWGIIQEIVTVDSSCFQIYMNNMKSLFVEMVRNADMVIFNRASQEIPLANFRRSVKVVNQAAEIIFEQEGGGIIDIFEDQLPYDLDQEVIDIAPEDYGIWYVDMMDNLEDYAGENSALFRAGVEKQRSGSRILCAGTHGHDLLRR